MERVSGQSSVYGFIRPQLPQPRYTVSQVCQSNLRLSLMQRYYRFGPNTFPAHNSVLFSVETQIEYIARTMLAPIIDQRASIIEVKGTAEDQWVNSIHGQLRGSVFTAGCSNWYINDYGRNSASWPGYASSYWKETLIPRRGIFVRSSGSKGWFMKMMLRWIRTTNPETYGLLGILLGLTLWKNSSEARRAMGSVFRMTGSRLTGLVGSLRLSR